MTDNCIFVVAEHAKLAAELQNHLRASLGLSLPVRDFSSVSEYLFRQNDGLLLAAAEKPEDERSLIRLLQEISLRKSSLFVVVVHQENNSQFPRLRAIENLVERIVWPNQAEELCDLVEAYDDCNCPFIETAKLSLEDKLRRELLEQTPSLAPMVERIAIAAEHDVTVLLTGETGTGKTHCARLIHNHSARHKERFLSVSCGALVDSLVESEFFGHVKGAFTGADRDKPGKFAAVGKGTLLLDEIDTLSLKHQAALLRVIETGEFEPVGAVETRHCQARILTASNVPLERAVEEATFRSDLYFRLNVMSFHFPPLCERREDIAPLVQNLAARFNNKFDKNLYDINPRAMAALEAFNWPGNIRQLENAVQHGVLVSSGREMQLQDLPELIQDHFQGSSAPKNGINGNALSLFHQRDLSERNAVQRALVKSGYNRSRAADALGISRVTLYKKLKKYGLTQMPSATGSKS